MYLAWLRPCNGNTAFTSVFISGSIVAPISTGACGIAFAGAVAIATFAIQNYGDKKYNEEDSFFNYSLPSTEPDEFDFPTFRDGLNLTTAKK